MMNNIQILPEEIINQISAGEVVDRPASVVKEFTENSLDAEATQIYVTIQNGGKELISVADNGHGMTEDNAKLAIERHATSKISITSDLDQIQTMGFRGEALAAIASVSRLELLTCAKEGQAGTRLEVEGGQLKQCHQVGFPQGTRVIVKQLFFNTPARLKFMKTVATEFRAIQDQFLSLVLIHHNIHFRLTHNNKLLFDFPEKNHLSERAYQLFPEEFGASVFQFWHEEPYLKLEGLFSLPSSTKRSRSKQYLFVNGRHIRSPEIVRSIYQSYGALIERGSHPLFILKIFLDPTEIDVNVHPAKTEIRFRNLKVMTTIIEETLTQQIRQHSENRYFSDRTSAQKIDQVHLPASQDPSENFAVFSNLESKSSTLPILQNPLVNDARQIKFDLPLPVALPQKQKKTKDKKEQWSAIIQLQDRYILAQTPQGLLCIDQEVASETILEKRLHLEVENDTLLIHTFHSPILLELAPHRALALAKNLPLFQQQGFTLEEFGRNTYRLLTAPDFLKYLDCASMIAAVIDQVIEQHQLNNSEQIVLEIRKQAAKLGAHSAGKVLSLLQMNHLLKDMQQLQISATDTNHKLIFIEWKYEDLDKQFAKRS